MPLSVRPEPIRTASEAAPRLVWPNSCPEPSNTRSGSPLATLTIGETSHPPITRLSHPVWACRDRKSTRLNSSHGYISYAVFCLKKNIRLTADYAAIHANPRPVAIIEHPHRA